MAANGFGNMIITQQGLNLLAKVQAGAPLIFTRVAVGDGYLNGQNTANFTSLIEQIMNLTITSNAVTGSASDTISTTLSNTNLTTGFYWREIGVFATDPQLGEILYGYDNSTGHEIYVPPISTSTFTTVLNINLYIGNSTSVTLTIDPDLVYAKVSSVPTKVSQLINDGDGTGKFATINQIPSVPSSLPASGGNSSTVNNHTASDAPETTEKADIIGMVNEVNSNLTSHLADNMLRLDIKGTQQYPTIVASKVTQILHQIGTTVVRTDIFTYTTNLITEVRTLTNGTLIGTLTMKYHTDTLEVEVI